MKGARDKASRHEERHEGTEAPRESDEVTE